MESGALFATAPEIAQLIATIKRELKAQGMTYRDVAGSLRVSEASIKRLFSTERFTVERLAQISELLGFTLATLHEESIPAPIADKHGVGLLLPLREWEPVGFRRLRKRPIV